jgi:hypothetical protein
MIYFVSLQDHDGPLRGLLRSLRPYFDDLRYISYERLFHDRRAPFGHYVFTDIDRLSHYEREVIVGLVRRLRAADPTLRILNDPQHVLERYPLLRVLEQQGINEFSVIRLDDGARPARYPVFIRCEDGHHGMETDLLHSEAEFKTALAALDAQGKVLKRKIAIGFRNERYEDGMYRKYGVINVAGHLMPQHVLRGADWMIKRNVRSTGDGYAEEELAFIRDNPHGELLLRVFQLAHIDFGRVDYCVVAGRVQVFEVNTNPHFPGLLENSEDSPARAKRREITRARFIEALRGVDVPLSANLPVQLSFPHPVYHEMRPWNRGRAARAWYRRWLSRHPHIKRFVPGRFW